MRRAHVALPVFTVSRERHASGARGKLPIAASAACESTTCKRPDEGQHTGTGWERGSLTGTARRRI